MHDPYLWMEYFTGWKTVGHIPSQILRYVYFFIKQERDRVYGKLKSLKYKTSRGEQTCLRSMVLLSCQSKENSNSIETYSSSIFEYYGRPKKHKRRHRTHTEHPDRAGKAKAEKVSGNGS